jgi:hypothetical protein
VDRWVGIIKRRVLALNSSAPIMETADAKGICDALWSKVKGHPDPAISKYSHGQVRGLVVGGLGLLEREAPELANLCKRDAALLSKFPPGMV